MVDCAEISALILYREFCGDFGRNSAEFSAEILHAEFCRQFLSNFRMQNLMEILAELLDAEFCRDIGKTYACIIAGISYEFLYA